MRTKKTERRCLTQGETQLMRDDQKNNKTMQMHPNACKCMQMHPKAYKCMQMHQKTCKCTMIMRMRMIIRM